MGYFFDDESQSEAAQKVAQAGLSSGCEIAAKTPYGRKHRCTKETAEFFLRNDAENSAACVSKATGIRHKLDEVRLLDDGEFIELQARIVSEA